MIRNRLRSLIHDALWRIRWRIVFPMDFEAMEQAISNALASKPGRCITVHSLPLFDEDFRAWCESNDIEDAFLLVALNHQLTKWHMHFLCNDGTFPRKYGGMSDSREVETTPARYEWTVPYRDEEDEWF